ncbi:MAG: hypothetical protein B7Y02_17150, partial [Rhodobacterales bacterium 17-64-5]
MVGFIGYVEISRLAENGLTERVTSLTKDGKAAVEQYYQNIALSINDMSASPNTVAGYRRLAMGWKSTPVDPSGTLVTDYIANNPEPTGHRKDFLRAEAQNTYNQQHAEFHPSFRAWAELHGYYDFFLIDLDGNIIYTVMKERDFASNLMTGPDRAGPLAKVFAQAKADAKAEVHFSDYAAYGPSAGVPAAFAAKALLDENGKAIGIVAIQLSDTVLNATLDGFSALGTTGEMVVIGADGLARSSSRFESGFHILDALPVLASLVTSTKGNLAAQPDIKLTDGNIGTASLIPLNLPGLDWHLAVEIDDVEALGPVHMSLISLAVGTLIAAVITTGMGVLIARGVTKPIGRISGVIRTISEG